MKNTEDVDGIFVPVKSYDLPWFLFKNLPNHLLLRLLINMITTR